MFAISVPEIRSEKSKIRGGLKVGQTPRVPMRVECIQVEEYLERSCASKGRPVEGLGQVRPMAY